MDIQSFFRLKNLIGSGANMAQPGLDTYSNSADSMSSPSPDNTPPSDTNSDLLDQFQPRHTITDQYTNALANMPQRPQPGMLRNIAAGIAGMGAGAGAQGISGGQPIGFKYDPRMADIASDKVKYPDYDNQLQDWQNQVKALGLGATEEDRANLNEAKRLAGNADRDIKQQAVDVKQQQIDINWKKEQDIYNTKYREETDKVATADANLMQKKRKLDLEGESIANLKEFQQAEIASRNARINAQKIFDDHKIEELKMNHEKQMAEMERKYLPKYTNTTATYNEAGQVTGRQSVTGPVRGNVRMVRPNPSTGVDEEIDVPENKVQDFIDNYGGRRKNP
jgi:hypothetical protein